MARVRSVVAAWLAHGAFAVAVVAAAGCNALSGIDDFAIESEASANVDAASGDSADGEAGCAVEVAHSNGIGQTYFDCAPLDTFNATQALAACAAYTGDASLCIDDPRSCFTTGVVCSIGFTSCACWKYVGESSGKVSRPAATCTMCAVSPASPTWN